MGPAMHAALHTMDMGQLNYRLYEYLYQLAFPHDNPAPLRHVMNDDHAEMYPSDSSRHAGLSCV